jgi:hypothetical protein
MLSTVRCATRDASAATSQPVLPCPTTSTRCPANTSGVRYSCTVTTRPLNTPGSSTGRGRWYWPTAAVTVAKRSTAPPPVRTSQPPSSAGVTSVTAVPSRRCGRRPAASA